MQVKSVELDSDARGYWAVVDETDTEGPFCPANVGPSYRLEDIQVCGKKMRKYKSGKTVCPDHGEMH